MLRKLLCFLGVHDTVFTSRYLPSIDADVITEVFFKDKCRACKKVFVDVHWVWDGEDMVDAPEEHI